MASPDQRMITVHLADSRRFFLTLREAFVARAAQCSPDLAEQLLLVADEIETTFFRYTARDQQDDA